MLFEDIINPKEIKMEDFNHKTIFVLDHTQYFGISGDNNFQLEFVNSKGMDAVLPVSKVFFYHFLQSITMILKNKI